MTSEVLILNKKAVVIGADSAVTTSSGSDHPRYSKNANKIFELSLQGSVAVTIYGAASVDGVPWELAIKLFRMHLGSRTFEHVSGYASALVSFLNGNDKLFPPELRDRSTLRQFDSAIRLILNSLREADASIFDTSRAHHERQAAWATQERQLRAALVGQCGTLPQVDDALARVLNDLDPWCRRIAHLLENSHDTAALDLETLAELAHRLRHVMPRLILPTTGLVITGFGEEQIFPAFEQLEIYGHLGDELALLKRDRFEVSHTAGAMIQPLAQRSMIDSFIDGFGGALVDIVEAESTRAMAALFSGLTEAGITVPEDLRMRLSSTCRRDFMSAWKDLSLQRNFVPLLETLHGLSVAEMAHLAESLLGLESLKERFTTPSESVGGPIDVVAITKDEGLIWIKQKNDFDPASNHRYLMRLDRSPA